LQRRGTTRSKRRLLAKKLHMASCTKKHLQGILNAWNYLSILRLLHRFLSSGLESIHDVNFVSLAFVEYRYDLNVIRLKYLLKKVQKQLVIKCHTLYRIARRSHEATHCSVHKKKIVIIKK
jgi:hypothetical protein